MFCSFPTLSFLSFPHTIISVSFTAVLSNIDSNYLNEKLFQCITSNYDNGIYAGVDCITKAIPTSA